MRTRSQWLKLAVAGVATTVTAVFVFSTAQTQPEGHEHSGFMEDYSILAPPPADDPGPDLVYRPAGVEKTIGKYTKIMIDQPEIFLAPDSPYKGMKPDQAKALADGFREILNEAFAEHLEVVEEPGPDVLYLRMGLTGLFLKRKVQWYNYTPIGAVTLGAKTAFIDNVAKKFSLIEVAVEAELYDSQGKNLLGASVEYMGQAKDKTAGIEKDPTSWKELRAFLAVMGNGVNCRVDNFKKAKAERTDCWAMVEAAQDPKKKQ